MSTRRQRELRLTRDQMEFIRTALEASVRRVVTLFAAHNSTEYEGDENDRAVVRQVLDGVVYELEKDLIDTLARITRKHLP